MVANIYREQNALRSTAATYAHFVEVCGMLAIHDRKKKKEGVNIEDALCKALGWYFPLLAKMRVKSVEEIIFRKYPHVCPYCRQAPHIDSMCKIVRGTEQTVNHRAVKKAYEENLARKPVTLNEWQEMFQTIYPRDTDDRGRSTIGLFEELGELGEAVRVFDQYPKYFAGEAADVFSYIMGIANEYSIRAAQDDDREFSFEDEFLKRYPGLCIQCGFPQCVCPSVPKATVGRMAKELDIHVNEDLFQTNFVSSQNKGISIASTVFEKVGGYRKLVDNLPFDRGDVNRALIVLCMKLASYVDSTQLELASKFRSAAIQLGTMNSEAGSPLNKLNKLDIDVLTELIRETWRELAPEQKREIQKEESGLVGDIGEMFGKVRVLLIQTSPLDQSALRNTSEIRVVKEAIRLSGRDQDVELDILVAATIDDFRRKLLTHEYEIVHFAGHADKDHLIFEDPEGNTLSVSISDISELIQRYPKIKCVILNACESAKCLSKSIAEYTVGMDDTVDDDQAIEFSRGFYDAIAVNKSIDKAIDEGIRTVKLKGFDSTPIKVLKRSDS